MIINNHGVYVVKNFIPKSQAYNISNAVKPLLQASPNPLVYCALGFPDQKTAALTSLENPIIPTTGNNEIDQLSQDITRLSVYIKNLLSSHYDKDLKLIQLTYNQMRSGSENHIHVDDATGMYSDLEYAALLYMTNGGKDYKGGEIYFPNQNLELSPEAGTLVFFKGDDTIPHGVKKVLEGNRENIIMFFNSKEKHEE
jgi:hypothetical protein